MFIYGYIDIIKQLKIKMDKQKCIYIKEQKTEIYKKIKERIDTYIKYWINIKACK